MTINTQIVNSLNKIKPNTYFEGIVKITRKIKPGPVIFSITDGTAVVDAITKDSFKNVGDVIELKGRVNEHNGKLQIVIGSINDSDKDFEEILSSLSVPKRTTLSIQSEKLEKLKPYFVKVASRVRKAILDNQPILIRHHADADGIMCGIAIEHACYNFMDELGMKKDFSLIRSPSKAPFYEIVDVFKDISFTKRVFTSHNQQKPLILVLDNGSTPEDVLAMKTLKTLGFEIIVIDHHNPVVMENKKTSVCPYLSFHINPYMEGLDSSVTAGMECYEVARMIHETFENYLLPAISGIGDKSETKETEQYIEKSGKTFQEIKDIVIALDYVAYQLKFDPGRGVYEELFTNPEFVKVLLGEVQRGVDTQLKSTLPYLNTTEYGSTTYSYIDLEKYSSRFTYPTPGKIIGIIHDKVSSGKTNAVLSVGYMKDMMIFRATKPIVPVPSLVEELQTKFPNAGVEGGGHECAGTIKFLPAHFDEVFEYVKNKVKKVSE